MTFEEKLATNAEKFEAELRLFNQKLEERHQRFIRRIERRYKITLIAIVLTGAIGIATMIAVAVKHLHVLQGFTQ